MQSKWTLEMCHYFYFCPCLESISPTLQHKAENVIQFSILPNLFCTILVDVEVLPIFTMDALRLKC
jgi:hypothetical protein